MQFFKNMLSAIIPNKEPPAPTIEQDMRNLLRENLRTIRIDAFTLNDPLFRLTGEDRKNYLKFFYDLSADGKLTERVKHLINRQMNMTVARSDKVEFDNGGAWNVNGMALIKDEIEQLAGMYEKEYMAEDKKFNKHGI